MYLPQLLGSTEVPQAPDRVAGVVVGGREDRWGGSGGVPGVGGFYSQTLRNVIVSGGTAHRVVVSGRVKGVLSSLGKFEGDGRHHEMSSVATYNSTEPLKESKTSCMLQNYTPSKSYRPSTINPFNPFKNLSACTLPVFSLPKPQSRHFTRPQNVRLLTLNSLKAL